MEEAQQKTEKIFSVSDYIDILNQGLQNFKAKIIGEVSEVGFSRTGNVYFRLKDEKDQSALKCMIYKGKYDMYGIKLKEGDKIIAEGYPNIHKLYSFAFIAEVIEYSGEGTLRKEYERLKKKLTEEGVLAKERKRPIPLYPQRVGIITSLKGAVIADFSNNLGKFGFKLKIVDSRVEGQVAVSDLLSSIKALKKQNIEVLVIMRGGGSLETLMPMMPFNNETLIREVINFPVPVIAAIGHHKDTPLISLVADLEVSTPSMAAIILNKSWEQAISLIERYETNIINLYNNQLSDIDNLLNEFINIIKEKFGGILDEYKVIEGKFKIFLSRIQDTLFLKRKDIGNALRFILKNFSKNLDGVRYEFENIDLYNNFGKALIIKEKYIADYSKSIRRDFSSTLENIKHKVKNIEKLINSYNPERQLKMGYSIARCKGKLIKSIKSVRIGEDVDIQVSDGLIQSEIKNINKQ